jgi:hypothetical protein
MTGIQRWRYQNEEETMVPSLVVTLGYPVLDRLTTSGPYLQLVLNDGELRGRVDAEITALIARWDSHRGQWLDRDGITQDTIIIAPFDAD